jgi:gluconate kinase
MKQSLIVVFGIPGAGKSYVAQIIAETFGYYSYNGDTALPSDMKEKILAKSDVTTDMRTRFVQNMIDEVNQLSKTHSTIVLHQALIKDHMRQQLLTAFPHATYIWVRCNDALLKKRYMQRSYFNLGLPYLQLMIDAFEPPTHKHIAIHNDAEGSEEIVKQLRTIDCLSNG